MKKSGKDRYVLCKECSEAAGEEVHYHLSALGKEEGFLDDPDTTTCPKGHVIEVPK